MPSDRIRGTIKWSTRGSAELFYCEGNEELELAAQRGCEIFTLEDMVSGNPLWAGDLEQMTSRSPFQHNHSEILFLRALFSCFWKIPEDGHCTASLGKPQCLTTITLNKLFFLNLLFQFIPITSHPLTLHHCKEPACIILMEKHGVLLTGSPETIFFSGWTNQAPSASPHRASASAFHHQDGPPLTDSNLVMSSLNCRALNWTQYSRRGLTCAE